jgi:hypothetical protein
MLGEPGITDYVQALLDMKYLCADKQNPAVNAYLEVNFKSTFELRDLFILFY